MIKEERDIIILIQNVLSGNLLAQETLYNKYKQIVKSFLRKKYSNSFDLDDDVSEIMIKIFLNLKSFDKTKSKFGSWVINIAKNHMIDKWRSNNITISCNYSNNEYDFNNKPIVSVTPTNNTFVTLNNIESLSFSSSGSFATSNNNDFENCNSICHIFSQLSSADFTLLNMKYVQGYDYCEIGKEFNVTSNTISNRVNYIKSKLKKNNSELIYD